MGASSKTGLSSVSNHLESILTGHCCRNDTEFRKHFSQLAAYVTQDQFGDYPVNEYRFLCTLQYFQLSWCLKWPIAELWKMSSSEVFASLRKQRSRFTSEFYCNTF